VVSIDVFRGLTMLVMIFVNQLAEMRGLPWWTYHMPASANGMTYVDMVFPFFLFIVGMSTPMAIRRRLSAGDSMWALALHVAGRAVALVVLGLILANRDKVNPSLTCVNGDHWTLMALLGSILFWMNYPKSTRFKIVFRSLKAAGLVLLVFMLVIFRRSLPNGQAAWLDLSYWEILGMIGWTYLSVCLLYIPTRRWPWMQVAWFTGLTALNILCCARWVTIAYRAPFYLWPFKSGAGASIVMAGVISSLVLLTDEFAATRRQKIIAALGFAALLFAIGWLTVPLGISKVHATPTWCLFSSAAAICIFLALYWVCDVLKQVRWATFVRPAGSNTLLTYLLPPLCAAVFGRQVLFAQWDQGWQGVAQAVGFTAGIMAIAALLTRWRVRVQL
jgi:predicted acyltransferase